MKYSFKKKVKIVKDEYAFYLIIITNQYFYADHVDKIFTEEPIRPPIV